jgi:hypothetical protein
MIKFVLVVFSLFVLVSSGYADSYVKGYFKSDGTYVQGHYRSSPNNTKADNFSTKGNYNPYTGKRGTKKNDWNINRSRSKRGY